MTARRGWLIVVAGWLGGGCAAQLPNTIVSARDLPESGGAPVIEQIVDLGGRDVPLDGTLDGQGADGRVAVGETLWIRGSHLGRQPTVTVAGRPAPVLSRTADGGILVRVPVGTPVGKQEVSVAQHEGSTQTTVDLQRYAVILRAADESGAADGKLGFLRLTPQGPVLDGHADAGLGAHLALSSDGRAAYVTGRAGGTIAVHEIAAANKGQAGFRIEIGFAPVRALVAGGPNLAVLRARDLLLFDTASALRPARRSPVPLPEALTKEKITAAAGSADGRYLALAVEAGNRIILLDLEEAKRGRDLVVASLPVDTETLAPLIVDLRFSPAGETLWALLGENPASLALGPQPTRIVAIRVAPASGRQPVRLESARTVAVAPACGPGRIATTRGSPLASGAAIRLPPEKVTVFFTGCVREDQRSAMWSVGAEDNALEIASTPTTLDAVDVEPEGHFVLAAFAGANGGLRVITARADGRAGEPHSMGVFGPAGPAFAPVGDTGPESPAAPSATSAAPVRLIVQP